jgi:hypothetical protein
VIGTIRRELDRWIIVHEAAWHRHLKWSLEYDHGTRTHLSLEKDTPQGRSVEPPECGACGSGAAGGRSCIIGTNVAPPKPHRDVERSHSTNSSTAESSRGRGRFGSRSKTCLSDNQRFLRRSRVYAKRRSPQQLREPGVLDRKTGGAVAKRS